MILRCFLLVSLVILSDPPLVKCAESSATGENSAGPDTLNSGEDSTLEITEFPTTTSTDYSDEETLSDSTETIQETSEDNCTVSSSHIENATKSILPVSSTTSEEVTKIPQENFILTDENGTPIELSESEKFTTLVNLENEFNMTFNKLLDTFMEETNESKQGKKRRKGRDDAAEIMRELDEDLVETESIRDDVKHMSVGIEPLALKAMPEKKMPPKPPKGEAKSWNKEHLKTSFLLVSDTEIDKSPFIEKTKGRPIEIEGNNRTHLAIVSKKSSEKAVYLQPSLTVELDRESNLLMSANERQELAFEVTNNLNSASRVSFTVRDELGILLEIDRYLAVLAPHTSTIVRVAVLPKPGQSSDRITFIATASEQVRKEVIVDIESNYRTDTDSPYIDYDYLSDCTDIVLSKCKEGSWTIKITAKDTDSGLKLLTTIPKGIYFPDGYTAGTREEVTGIYSESCCNADLEIIAIDRMNNRYVRQINAYRAPLSFWAIIAIVLVSLIFLTIIVVSSYICLKRCKKNEADSFDLPTYRGGRSRF